MKTMNAKYPGTCRYCQGRIRIGERIEWAPRAGARHVACAPQERAWIEESEGVDQFIAHDYRNLNHLQNCERCQATDLEVSLAQRERDWNEQEYQRGIHDVENWRENRRMFGDEMAEQMEIEREMREGDY